MRNGFPRTFLAIAAGVLILAILITWVVRRESVSPVRASVATSADTTQALVASGERELSTSERPAASPPRQAAPASNPAGTPEPIIYSPNSIGSDPTKVPRPGLSVREGGAKVSANGQTYQLSPNAAGNYPRVVVPANAVIPVEVGFPAGDPDEPVVIEAEDGGKVDLEAIAKVKNLGDNRSLSFQFRVNAEEGVYRVLLRRGADVRMLDFWVGKELPIVYRR